MISIFFSSHFKKVKMLYQFKCLQRGGDQRRRIWSLRETVKVRTNILLKSEDLYIYSEQALKYPDETKFSLV